MQKKSQDFSIEDAKALADSPAGRQLLGILSSSDSGRADRAVRMAEAGSYGEARALLSDFLEDPRVLQLLGQLGGFHE